MKLKKTIATTLAAAMLASVAVTGQVDAATKNFSDLKESNAYYSSVQKLVQFKIISGYEDATFRPDQVITRGQIATIIARALELDLSNVKNPHFKDVPTTHANYKAIAALTNLGVFKTNEYFNPGNNLTHAQISQILVLAFDLDSKEKKTYTDVKATDWSAPYIGVLGALNLVHFKEEDKFYPKQSAKRIDVAVFIERIISYKRQDDTYDIWDNWTGWETTVASTTNNGSTEKLEEYIEDKWYDNIPDDDDDDWLDDWDLEDDDWDLDDWDLEEYEPEIDDKTNPTTTPVTLSEPEMASFVFDLEKSTKDLDSAIIRLKADIKDYKEVERSKAATKKEVEDVLDDVDSSQLHMRRTLEKADVLLKEVVKVTQTTKIANAKKELERKIVDATAELKTSTETIIDIESLQDDMEDAVKDVLKETQSAEKTLLKENADVEDLEDAYEELSDEVSVAKKLLDHSNTSKVAVVRGLKAELEQTVKDAEKVMKQLLEKVGDLEMDYEDATDRMIKRLYVLKDSFYEAVSSKNKSDIKYHKERLLEKMDEAEDLIDEMEDTKLNKVKPYIQDLEDEIVAMERFIEKAERRID